MLHARGFLAEVFNILARHAISVDLITMDTTGSTTTGASLLTQALLTELSSLCRVEVEEDLALVALIGNKLSQACEVGKEVFGVLDPFNIRLICYGASSHNLCLLVPGGDGEQVVKNLARRTVRLNLPGDGLARHRGENGRAYRPPHPAGGRPSLAYPSPAGAATGSRYDAGGPWGALPAAPAVPSGRTGGRRPVVVTVADLILFRLLVQLQHVIGH